MDLDSVESALKDPDVHEDPYPFYERLRHEAPRARTRLFDSWVLSTWSDAHLVLREPRLSSSPRHQPNYDQFVELAGQLGFGPILETMGTALLFMDPPDHTRLRRLVGKAFTPRAVAAMQPEIERLVAELLADVRDREGMDVVTELAYPLPVRVISRMLGVPTDDHDQLSRWTAAAVTLIDPSGDDFGGFLQARQAMEGFTEYFEELVEDRRHHLGHDLLSALLQAEEDGEHLTHQELMSTVGLLYIAGHETTVNLIGNGLLALLRHGDEQRRLRADPGLAGSAVEEMLRYDSPVQLTARNATVDLDLDGIELRRGQQVIVLLGAANRDAAQFPNADRLDVGRSDNRHVAFGGGIHLCLGAPLARAEARAALAGLVTRLPELHLADDRPPRKPTTTLRGLASLPVGWD